MKKKYNTDLLEELLSNKKFTDLCNLLSVSIVIEKNKNIPILNIFIEKNIITYSLNAIYWKKTSPFNYKRLSVQIKIPADEIKFQKKSQIRKDLLEQIYFKVIKKEIMSEKNFLIKSEAL